MAHRYFLSHMEGTTAYITGEEARHLAKVMRLQPGEKLTLCDKAGYDYPATAQTIGPDEVVCQVGERVKNPAEPARALTLYMALPKGDKLELIVQKACELGAVAVVPFVSQFCVAQKSKKEDSKRDRLQKIANEACKQCGRSAPMEVRPTMTFSEMVADLKGQDETLFFYEHATIPLAGLDLTRHSRVGLIVGSEGGFSEKECQMLAGAGATTLSLGKRILRCETAAIAGVALAMSAMGELS